MLPVTEGQHTGHTALALSEAALEARVTLHCRESRAIASRPARPIPALFQPTGPRCPAGFLTQGWTASLCTEVPSGSCQLWSAPACLGTVSRAISPTNSLTKPGGAPGPPC